MLVFLTKIIINWWFDKNLKNQTKYCIKYFKSFSALFYNVTCTWRKWKLHFLSCLYLKQLKARAKFFNAYIALRHLWKTQYEWNHTQSDKFERLVEADTEETQLHGIVVSVPDKKFSIWSNFLHSSIVDVTTRLERSHILAVNAEGTVDVAQPVWPLWISTVHPVCCTTTLVDLHRNNQHWFTVLTSRQTGTQWT